MKVIVLLALVLVGAYAQTVTNWDLSEISPESGIVEADKKPALTGQSKKASNQGYTARYSQQGKTLKMSLTVQKETSVRVTDTDRLLFGMETTDVSLETEMANMTLSYGETASICEASLGSTWETMVHLPTEDLTYIEALRLATSLNEFQLLNGNGLGKKGARGPGKDFDCICHGTAHRFQTELGRAHSTPGEFKGDGPFWGVRILGTGQKGHGQQAETTAHNPENPYADRDCMLCDHASNPIDDGWEYDCKWCCFGKCVVKTGEEGPPASNGVDFCNREYRFDDGADGEILNPYLMNPVGACRLPKNYECKEEVHNFCTCDSFIAALFDSDTGEVLDDCDYCNRVVGHSEYHCPNCSYAIAEIEAYGQEPGFRGGEQCDCGNAFWQIANSDVGTEADYDYDHDSYDYDDGYDRRAPELPEVGEK